MHDRLAVSVFARTNARQPYRTFGIRQADRLFHLYAIGRTGTGKSTLIETLVQSDLLHGRGCAVIDPHGDSAARLAAYARVVRPETVYWNVADPSSPYGYNPLRRVRHDTIPLAASGLLEAMKKLWADAWGVRMEHVLRNALYALLEYGDATLPDVLTLCFDKDFRRVVLAKVRNEQVHAFWTKEFMTLNPLYRKDAVAPIQNKIGAFLADPRLYRILTTAPEQLSFRRMMDDGTPLIVNLARGALGDDSANLLGALIVSTMGVAALSRASVEESARRPYHLFIDEFQSFTTLAFADMISMLRKYGVSLTLANQHLAQLEPEVRHSVLANVGTLIAFRVGPEDAPVLAREFAPTFSPLDLVGLTAHDVIMKLMIDGAISQPFSATTCPPAIDAM
jgi:Type IV secretion-system coupling protein DNA-binding domain